METRSQRAQANAPALGIALVVAALGFAQGGFFPGAWVWSTVLLAWVGISSLLLAPRLSLDRVEVAWIGVLASLAAWTLLSTTWSASPAQSVLEARRDLVYVTGAVAVALAARRSSLAYLLGGLWGAASLVVVTGLVRYLVERPGRAEVVEGGLLFRPVGYANGLAALAATALLLAAWLVARASSRAVHAAAAASFVPLAAALKLTESRGAALALLAGSAAGLALDPRRRDVVARVAPAAIAAGIAVWLAGRSQLSSSDLVASSRRSALLGAEILLLATAAAIAPRPRALRLSKPFRIGLAALLAVAVVGVAASRPGLGGGSYRQDYWTVAWHEYLDHPVLGSGAGTFARYWALRGSEEAGGALDAHGLYVEMLAELGPVGLVLTSAAVLVPLARASAARAGALGPASVAAFVVFVVQAAIDWDWELAAVTLCGLASGGAILAGARSEAPAVSLDERRLRALVGAALVALAALALAGSLSGAQPGI